MIRRLMVGAVLAGLLGAAATASAAENWSGRLYPITEDGLGSMRVPGSRVTLVRHADAVSYAAKTTQLEPGHAYTVWLMAWNHPEYCLDESDSDRGYQCGPDDFANAAAVPSMMWGAGGVATGSTYTFTGERRARDLSRVIFGPGIGNSAEAEVKFIVRDHGPASDDPDMRYSQTTSIDGGCSGETAVMPPTGQHGQPGDNACRDVQASGAV